METAMNIQLGDVGFKHPNIEGILFGTIESAKGYCERENEDPSNIYHVDTRPTINEVMLKIREAENAACNIDENTWTCGPWDEYFSLSAGGDFRSMGDQKWPQTYSWISVYVVTGGSEGLYLHISIIDGDKHKLVFLGKTLSSGYQKWNECYESAARIAWMLNA